MFKVRRRGRKKIGEKEGIDEEMRQERRGKDVEEREGERNTKEGVS